MKATRAGARILLPAAAALLASCGGGSTSRLPSRLERFPGDLADQRLEASGIYADGWTAETAAANLQKPGGEQAVAVRGIIPGVGNDAFRADVEVRVDGRAVARRSVGVGEFRISAPVPGRAGMRRVQVIFTAAQQLPGGDGRTVGAQLRFLGFEPAGAVGSVQPMDIIRGGGLELGPGWGEKETFRGETFRWVENDAQIRITSSMPGDAMLTLQVEAGPGLGTSAFLLRALDASGRQVAAVKVNGRKPVALPVPVEPGKPNEFRLHVDGGGRRVPQDARILNFRVFEIEAVEAGH